jgi:hypothetical protein
MDKFLLSPNVLAEGNNLYFLDNYFPHPLVKKYGMYLLGPAPANEPAQNTEAWQKARGRAVRCYPCTKMQGISAAIPHAIVPYL